RSLCLPPARMHFCAVAARTYGRLSKPRNTSLNWFIPALVNSSVGSSPGTTGLEATTVWPFDSKNFRKVWRISAAFIRGSFGGAFSSESAIIGAGADLRGQERKQPLITREGDVEPHPVRRLQVDPEEVPGPEHDPGFRRPVGQRGRVGQLRVAHPEEHAGLGLGEELEAERRKAPAHHLM